MAVAIPVQGHIREIAATACLSATCRALQQPCSYIEIHARLMHSLSAGRLQQPCSYIVRLLI